jgi:ribonuclease D
VSLLYLDSETTGLDPHHDRMALFQFMREGDKDVTLWQEPDPEKVRQLIDSADVIVGHNIGFDLGFLDHHVPPGRIHDTMYLSRLVDYKADSFALDDCALRAGVGHLFEGINKKAMQKLKWDQVDLDGPAGDYARADVLALPAVYNRVRHVANSELYRFDENSIRAGLRIQRHGLPILHPEAAAYRNRLAARQRRRVVGRRRARAPDR